MRALTGKGDTERAALGDRLVVDVADLFTGGRLKLCGAAAFCSNIPIKDVVGGIDEVSNGGSTLSRDELPPLRTDGDLGPRPDDRSLYGCLCPVGFGLTEADLEAAKVAAIKEGVLEESVIVPGGCKKPSPPS